MANINQLKKELEKRSKSLKKETVFKLEQVCFSKQLDFINDKSKFKTAVCSRRAGKSTGCGYDLIYTALTEKGDVAYITLNRRTAKRIIWRQLLDINKQMDLQAKIDNIELTLTLSNGNIIYVSGAKDEADAEKWRGVALRKVYIDEAQSFRSYLKDFIEDIIEPTLIDYDGSLILIGTPGPLPTGYFYESSHNDLWSHHKWTIHDNPYIKEKSKKDPEQIIEEVCARRGVSKNHPSILREFYGQWVQDNDALVFKFNKSLNITSEIPKDLTYIFGIDIGFQDSDAIAVLGYSNQSSTVYLVEEWIANKQNITSLANRVEELKNKYNPVKMVMDAGALGKKIQEELRTRFHLPLEAADKTRKLEFIELLNDDLRTSKFKTFKNSRFEEDCYLIQWDYSNPDKVKISDSYHTDIGDAVLYAWRACNHYFPRQDKKIDNMDEYMQKLEELEAEQMDARKKGDDSFTDINSFEDLGISEDDDFNF